jgi:putative sterol carrier protein
MKENGFGRIVMTTSAAGLYGNFGQTNYSAAKMALVGMMNALKLEGKKYDIRVNTVAPLAASRLTEDIMPPDMFARMKPELVSPLVLYLCSDRCTETGSIFNTGMGYVNRAAIMTGPGAVIGDREHPPTPEQIDERWDQINTTDGAKELSDLTAALMDLMTPSSPTATPETAAPAKPESALTVAAVFEKMPGAFVKDAAAGVDVIFQYCIAGPGGGDWSVAIKDQTCTVTRGRADKATCTLNIGDTDFIRLISGELPAMQAYTSGKLKIEGDIMKSQLIERLFKLA